MAGTAFAIDQPPQEPDQQRAWLVGHLVTDMEALGTFDGNALAKVPGIVNALTEDQVALLAQYYYLTRSKTEQDASLYAMQQQGDTDEQVNAAKAEVADLLTDDERPDRGVLRPVRLDARTGAVSRPDLLRQRAGLVLPRPVLRPGLVLRQRLLRGAVLQRRLLRASGACRSAGLLRPRQPFLRRYHNVANTVYINRSINVAHRRADWFRQHGDWQSSWRTTGSCTRLERPPARAADRAARQPGQQPPCAQAPAARTGAKQIHPNGNHKAVAQHQEPKPYGEPRLGRHTRRRPSTRQQSPRSHASGSSSAEGAAQQPAQAPRLGCASPIRGTTPRLMPNTPRSLPNPRTRACRHIRTHAAHTQAHPSMSPMPAPAHGKHKYGDHG